MLNLAEIGIACECGSSRLVASGSSPAVGAVCICATCGRTFRVELNLAPVAWSACALELLDVDYLAFEWTRRGLPAGALERLNAGRNRFKRADRIGAALGAVLVVLLVLVASRAVFS